MGSLQDQTALVDRLEAIEFEIASLRQEVLGLPEGQAGLVEVLLRNISTRAEVALQLEQAQSWIQFAHEVGGVAAYRMDIPNGPLVWSGSTYALYGLKGQETPSLELWLSCIHPDDRASVTAVAEAALKTGAPVNQTYRVALPDGEVRWIEDRGRVMLDHQGRPRQVIGLNIDVTALRHAQQKLEDRELEYRLTFESAAVGIAHVGLDGRFLAVNESLTRMLGYDQTELLAKSFQTLTHPEDLAEDMRQVERLLAGEADRYEMEKRYIRADGGILWACLAVALKRDAEGHPLHFISVVSDISDKKAAEERSLLLMREMNHRAKNVFAVIQSLIVQTSRHEQSVDSFATRLEDRLRSLSISHDLLTASKTDQVLLDALVREQLQPFVEPNDPRLRIWGPGLNIGPDTARNLGLALHELATNACKYGALTATNGRLDVKWRVTDLSSPDALLVMEWRESDGPEVRPPSRTGFGTRVVRDMVARSLRAEVDLDFAPTGFVWTVGAPLGRFAA